MKVLIIEDEPIAADHVATLLKRIVPKAEIAGQLSTVHEAVSTLRQNHFDLILLDIELADGSCFEIFRQISVTSPIIFITAYDQYALRAFEVHSADYILKPVTEKKLSTAITRLRERQSAFLGEYHKLAKASTKEYKQRFLVRVGNKLIPIESKDILFFYAEDKWIDLTTKDHKRLAVDYSLSQLEDLLDPKEFFRINRQYIVHRQALLSVTQHQPGQVAVHIKSHSLEAPVVSRRVTPLFKQWLSGNKKP